MTAAEETLLAEGKNFEHSEGSIGTSKLELLFRAKFQIELTTLELIKQNPQLAENVIYLFYISF
jgi:hypothetical protein